MSRLIALADAVVAELNGGAFSQPFTAERHYRPVFSLPQMATLHVSVVPSGLTEQIQARDQVRRECQIDVAVQKKLTTGDHAEIDTLMDLVQEIADFVRFKTLNTDPPAVCVRLANEPIYAPEHLEQKRTFTSVLTLTFRWMG